ncbi:hypothetical protein AEP_01647 [Curvibacter sp. AEP1-3]|uniref:hypothetical protein n=1 Tax=Curvibacter sp. AEP1-3 TaxID=1844971 RepID=UPI000B3C79B3|nr:hypothetical protein [Curvibacter sp. AEP1-3]ARV18591.1 hypothetical protein AEP_01647 [Curvibacter sp. AEP1-3]
MQAQFFTHPSAPAFAPSAKDAGILSALRTWLRGDPLAGERQSEPAGVIYQSPPELPQVQEPQEFRIALPERGNTPMRAFGNVLTSSITEVVANTADLQEWAPDEMYGLRVVYIDLTGAPDRMVHYLNSLQPQTLAHAVKNIIAAAPGASGTIDMGDYFGCTIVADIHTVNGHPVERLASFGGTNFKVRFAFDGHPVTRPKAPPLPVTTVAQEAPQQSGEPNLVGNTPPPAGPVPADRYFADSETSSPECNSGVDEVSNTPISKARAQGYMDVSDTPLSSIVGNKPAAVAQMRLRSRNGEVLVPLLADNFPYTIGRHPSMRGYAVKGEQDTTPAHVLADAEPQNFVNFTSRDHLVLESYNSTTQAFCVINKGRNGTFFRRSAMPSHFLLPQDKMAQGEWLKLGGTDGDAILELRMEAA